MYEACIRWFLVGNGGWLWVGAGVEDDGRGLLRDFDDESFAEPGDLRGRVDQYMACGWWRVLGINRRGQDAINMCLE